MKLVANYAIFYGEDFNVFIDNVIREYPNGYYSNIAREFLDGADYVGKQENLADDLRRFLDDIGEEYDARLIDLTPVNESSEKVQCEYTPEQEAKILEIESYLIERYYA